MTTVLSELTPFEIEQAIHAEAGLRDLILSKHEEAEKNNVGVEGFYYSYYVACSDEIFDQFSLQSIQSLFTLYGYEVKCEEKSLGEFDEVIEVTVSKEKFAFKMFGVEGMHDSLYAIFVNTETAELV